jgi:hypothetical protein
LLRRIAGSKLQHSKSGLFIKIELSIPDSVPGFHSLLLSRSATSRRNQACFS